MQITPDLIPHGYEIITELGRNREGGRITWKGRNLDSDRLVVIKQFCFATADSSWSGYKSYQREIELLQNLHHPGIPKYLDSLETDNGFCLIQEYIEAIPLAELANITLEKVQIITIRILEILVYLQEREDFVLHRDLKPENILVDKEFKPYLIDFGLAKIGDQDNSASSIIQGTPGFMAPEQAIAPVKASDLYGLGVTIICLLTQKKSSEILSLATAENPYQLEFKPLLSQLDSGFLAWLSKMVQPQVKKRFPDAATALKKLQELTWDWQNLAISNADDLAIESELVAPDSRDRINQLANLGSKIPLSPFAIGTISLGVLVTAITVGFEISDRVTEKNLFNLTIAAIGIVIIYISQSAAAVSFNMEQRGNKEAIAFAIAFPLVLVAVSGVLLGWGEAVAMTISVAIAIALNLGYVLLQTISFQFKNHKLAAIGLVIAIFSGLLFGNIITP
ncbi:serine/threonine protein kinase [Xenococcus sp. PCC 7305]|uniref:serine/threonine protein kinase n=1 Tax=Xenococcus sp. PCC 7305 TaxID=102125 RepID=UPI0002ABBA31|nr:protein kinase [Xenococcus sp. PCC 7305]ELS03986.1 serine/threonine protein kinase [Xenococcus sp. PCC 7305]